MKRLRSVSNLQVWLVGQFSMIRIILLLSVGTTLGFGQSCVFAQTPHTLLWDGSPRDARNALEMMKEDPTWISRKDSDRRTPLHVAARFDHIDVVEWLLDNGADVDAQAYNRFTPLHLTKNPKIVKLILGKNPNLLLESSVTGSTAVQRAIEDLRHFTEISGRVPQAKRKADNLRKIVELYVNHLGDEIDLISAARLGQLKAVQQIVRQNPALAHSTKDGNPLREAADYGHLEICKFLVEKHKVDVNDFEGGAGYPIIKAALKHPQVVKYLIEQGADLKTRITWRGVSGPRFIGDEATALHFAARDGVPETIQILLDAGVEIFATTDDTPFRSLKKTALEVAAYFGKTDNAIAMLEHQQFRDSDAKDRELALAKSLSIASKKNRFAHDAEDRAKLYEALIAHGAKDIWKREF